MTKDLLISVLRKGQTGEEILNILDTIVGDSVENVSEIVDVLGDTIQGHLVPDLSVEPTLDPIQFWSYCDTYLSVTIHYQMAFASGIVWMWVRKV